jgi:hypothetical protein
MKPSRLHGHEQIQSKGGTMNNRSEVILEPKSALARAKGRLASASEAVRGKMCMADARVRTFLSQPDEGAATAEYAVVLVAATGFGAVLVALLKSGAIKELLKTLVTKALKMA